MNRSIHLLLISATIPLVLTACEDDPVRFQSADVQFTTLDADTNNSADGGANVDARSDPSDSFIDVDTSVVDVQPDSPPDVEDDSSTQEDVSNDPVTDTIEEDSGSSEDVSPDVPVDVPPDTTTVAGRIRITKCDNPADPPRGDRAEVACFELTSLDESAWLQKITLSIATTTDHTSYQLVNNGQIVTHGSWFGDKVIFDIENLFYLEEDRVETFQINAIIGGEPGDTITTALSAASDLEAIGAETGLTMRVDRAGYGRLDCQADSSDCSMVTIITAPCQGTDADLGITRDNEGRRWAPEDENRLGFNQVCAGWYVRSPDQSTVWFIDPYLERRRIPFDLVIFTWIDDWDDIVWVSQASIDELTRGPDRATRPGMVLIKQPGDEHPEVYAIMDADGDELEPFQRHWIMTDTLLIQMLGFNYADYIIDYEDPFFADFETGAPISEPFAMSPSSMRTRAELEGRRDGTWP